jgi:hypothetical protein
MPILGVTASGISGHLGPVPSQVTLGTVTRTNNTTVSIPFTAGAVVGTSYVVRSTPSISLTVSGTTSPLTVTGTFAANTQYTFTVAGVNAYGTGAYSTASNSVPIYYTVGGTGPGGGIVFYDAGTNQSWGRYMEAAMASASPAWNDITTYWSANSVNLGLTGSYANAGNAYTNAAIMLASDNTAGYAQTVCKTYAGNGKTDWVLPTNGDAAYMDTQKTILNLITTNWYWCCNDINATYAGGYKFNGTGTNVGNKTSTLFYVRPIRYF